MGRRARQHASPQLQGWLAQHADEAFLAHHVGGLYTATLRPCPEADGAFERLRHELAGGDAPASLGAGVSLHDLWAAEDGISLLVSDDDDWSDRVPARRGDDTMPGVALVPFFDIAERLGVAPEWWRAWGLPDRNHLLHTAAIPWDVVRKALDALAEHVGSERLRQGCRATADLTRGTVPAGVEDAVGVLSAAHDVVRHLWRPVYCHVVPVRPGFTCVRMGMRAGLGGCRATLASHAGSLESLPRHLGLPFGRVTRLYLEADAVRATYILEHAVGRSPLPAPRPHTRPERPVDELIASRLRAREKAGQALGEILSGQRNIHELVDRFFEGSFAQLALHGLTLELAAPGGEFRPFRSRGDVEGDHPMERILRYRDQPVARLRARAPVECAGELLAVLDLVQPWLAAGIGAALETARLRAAQDVANAETQVVFRALDAALERFDRPAFTMEADGRVVPKNGPARAITASDAALAHTLAAALGAPDEPFERVLLPPEHGGMLLVARNHPRSLDQYFAGLANDADLSPRRREVARQILAGRSVEQVAEGLGIREGTVRAHLTSVYKALGVDGHVGFLVRCLESAP